MIFLRSIRIKRFLYDFQDFIDGVHDKGTLILMHPEDFIDFQNEKGSAEDVHCPLIADISKSSLEEMKLRFSGNPPSTDQDYKESEFLKLKFRKQCKNRVPCPRKGGARGINAVKKANCEETGTIDGPEPHGILVRYAM